MIKKYEIITVEGRKRVKALRSFSVQGRYVNVGDVGGIVYDENTLSQEGNAWIFSGNLGYPSIRVSGDSIVDTNGYEAEVTDPRPIVSITGTSALIGAHDFVTGALAARELAVADVEQGYLNIALGPSYEECKINHANYIRLKSLIYAGNTTGNITVSGEGYEVLVLHYDSNKRYVSSSSWGATAAISGADYIGIVIRKTPSAATVPADITEAKVALPALSIEAYLDINDSRLEFQYTGAMTVATKVNLGKATSGVLKSVIDTSNVIISKTGNGAFVANIFADVVKCNVEWKLISARGTLVGNFTKVDRLLLDGTITYALTKSVKALTTVRDCRTFALSAGVFPIDAANDAIKARMPFVFTRCNVEHGLIYHNPVNRNIYTDIDFSKASADLGKALTFGILCSSEVEGMYRVYRVSSSTLGALVESYDSIKDANFSDLATMVATTIYKDAKLTGLFNISGTNVFGGTGNHGGGKGCEITNTKETAMVISGNVRVEGNAKVKDTRITGTGYFGGNSVTENACIVGSAYVTDNGVFSPAPEEGKFDSDIHIEDNAKFLATSRAGNTVVYMCGDSEFSGTIAFNTISLAMYGKSRIAGGVSGRGVLILEDNADTSNKNVEAYGCIRLVGNYRQTKEKIWTGRRTISSENEPTYDNNVKTKYDF